MSINLTINISREMSDEIFRIKSISQLHDALGLPKPKHPLITLIDPTKVQTPKELMGIRMTSDLYSIMLKDGSCGMLYGRKHFDFDSGVLVFTAPDQVKTFTESEPHVVDRGWMLLFHPDLLRRSSLGDTIDNYSFFGYEINEALHLSDEEEKTLLDLVNKIEEEYSQRIDNHSQKVIVATIELLLSYCSRFYERQFNTRSNQNKDTLGKVQEILKEYFSSGQLAEYGAPSIHYLAEKVHLSSGYLSDLLKKETGRSGKDHINHFLIEKAKNLLLRSKDSVSEIAFELGFNYPHYFSRLFKAKTGMTPHEYRETEL